MQKRISTKKLELINGETLKMEPSCIISLAKSGHISRKLPFWFELHMPEKFLFMSVWDWFPEDFNKHPDGDSQKKN